jgi:hypothetical protein
MDHDLLETVIPDLGILAQIIEKRKVWPGGLTVAI